MKKNKGFTLIELIIAMALTIVVIAVASTFFISTIKTFKRVEVSSNLQLEAEKIESLLVEVGMQSEKIEEINGLTITSIEQRYYKEILPENGKLQTEEIKFKLLNEYYILDYDKETSTLNARRFNNGGEELTEWGYPKILSTNISEFTIRPIDFRMNEGGSLYGTNGIEINLNIKDIKGKSGVEMPFSLMVKFRNK